MRFKLSNIVSQLILVGFFCSLTACKTLWGKDDDEDDGPYKGKTAVQLYQEGNDALAKKDYTTAGKHYEALETMYPFNDYAEQAELNLIYTYYKKQDYPSAAAEAERFIHLYPRAKRVDYAYYMKGLADFNQLRGTITAILPVDQSWRDPGTQSVAYSDFATLVQKFPDSQYKANALQRMIYLRNMFAQTELNVSKYYLERKMHVAAVERANYLIKTYPQAPSVDEAFVIVYRGNLALGLTQAADDARAVYWATYHRKLEDAVLNFSGV
jgi:outer membrane protein assembly factor BamD